MKQTQAHQEVQIAVFKKAMDIQVQGALALIEALPTPPSSKGLPAHIGNNVNTVA
ncbi:MAG TPA: putative motility protein [Thiomicrospira sp.]|nr:putative motility protein [Flavobacteriaceae bacterium]HBQ44833.1 putative motility protein [Thiomicrospira sp.]